MNKRAFLRGLAVLALVGGFSGPVLGESSCANDQLDIRSAGKSVRFTVEVADDAAGRARGLMNRPELGPFKGMLFVYPAPHPVNFWMRNTLIPLDMLFIDARGVVETVHENAVPLDETPIYGGPDIQYVLEINGGLARRLGIGVGSVVRHPAVKGPEVLWPCE